jgi:hypothetical protein
MKITIFGFVFSSVFMIGMGQVILVVSNGWVKFGLNLVAVFGFYFIIKLTEKMGKEM